MRRLILYVVFVFGFCTVKAQLTFPHVTVLYDSVWQYKNLALIPVRFNDTSLQQSFKKQNVLSLVTAMQQRKVVIKENSYDGRENVNVLNIQNNSKESILITNGELLKGGKQDRMIAETQLIAPGKAVSFMSVFCIEKGRWDKKPKPFKHAGFANYALQKVADSTNVQQQVWREIEQQFKDANTTSSTYPFLQLQQKNSEELQGYYNYFISRFNNSDSSYAGFIAVTDSTIIGCELFNNAQLHSSSFTRILQKYIGAVTKPNAVVAQTKNLVYNYAQQLLSSEAQQKKFVEHNGKIFIQHNKTVHLIAYGFKKH